MTTRNRIWLSAGTVLVALGMMTASRTEASTIVGLAICSGGGPDCTPPPPNSGFIGVAAGNYHGMGLRSDGSIATWGMCDVDQCSVPPPNSGYTAIAAGDSHSVALRPDGSIVVWGSNEAGQHAVPEPNSGYVAISAGLLHTLALRSDGSIVGWGSSPGGSTTPPAPNTDWVAIAAGGFQSMGLKSDGSIRRWGCFPEPCELPSPNTGFIAIATHYSHSLALRGDGSIVAWGNNDFGQLDVPAPNTGFVAVAAGNHFSIGLKSDGSVATWGQYDTSYVPLPNAGFEAITANSGFAYGLRSAVTWSCSTDADCDDGLFCNGLEDCVGDQCQAGVRPCAQACRESDDQCVQCLNRGSCADFEFCNGVEVCTAAGNCQAGTPFPCTPPLFCSEIWDRCVQCSGSAQCSDGHFCTGVEFCSAGDCHPGSNPCPGQGCNETSNACIAGSQVAAGRVPNGAGGSSPLRLQMSGSNLTLSWGASCLGTDTDYAVYEGTIGGTFTSHASRVCSTSGLTTATFAPAAGNRYYLIVPRNSAREGSYGTTSGGVERPVGLGQCAAQLIGSCP